MNIISNIIKLKWIRVNGNHQFVYCSHSNYHTHLFLFFLISVVFLLSVNENDRWRTSPVFLLQHLYGNDIIMDSSIQILKSLYEYLRTEKKPTKYENNRSSWLDVTMTTLCSLQISTRNYHFLLICNTDISLCVILSAGHELSLEILSSLQTLLYGWQWEVFGVLHLVTWKLIPFTQISTKYEKYN